MIVTIEILNSRDASRKALQAKLTGIMESKDPTREMIAVLKNFPEGLKYTIEST